MKRAPALSSDEARGLILRIDEGDARLARQVALFVPRGRAASAYSTAGAPVWANWEGTLHLESRPRLIFTLGGTGSATLSINGELLCDQIGKPTERKRLSTGRHPIRVEFSGPPAGDASLTYPGIPEILLIAWPRRCANQTIASSLPWS